MNNDKYKNATVKKSREWVYSRNPINGNTSCIKTVWLIVDQNGNEIDPPVHERTKHNSCCTKKSAIKVLEKRRSIAP